MNQKPLFSELIEEKPRFSETPAFRVSFIITLFFLFFAGIMSFNNYVMKNEKKSKSPGLSIEMSPQDMVMKIQQLEKEIKSKHSNIFKLISTYKSQTGENFRGLNLLDLTKREKKLLEKRIKEEKSVTIKSLLSNILKNSDQISNMKNVIYDLMKKLPTPTTVQKGENHFQLAYEYLIKTIGIEKELAIKLVRKSVLLDSLAPGFKVWNFFNNGIFGTFVTQGIAKVSPGKLHRIVKERLIAQKEKAITENKKLGSDIEILKINNSDLNMQLVDMNTKNSDLSYKITDLDEKHQVLNKKWNSMLYKVDLDKRLVKEGVLKRGFLKKAKMNQINNRFFYKSIDLRDSKEIYVRSDQFNSKKIKKVTLFPKFYKKGIDYEVIINDQGAEAILTILTPEKLKNEKVVISVGL